VGTFLIKRKQEHAKVVCMTQMQQRFVYKCVIGLDSIRLKTYICKRVQTRRVFNRL